MTQNNPEQAPTPGEPQPEQPEQPAQPEQPDERVIVIGPDGMAVAAPPAAEGDGEGERPLVDLVEQPAKVMRIGTMIGKLLEEVRSAPLDEAGRARLAQLLESSLTELKEGLAPELDEELDRLVAPFSGPTPSESELRIAQAQLVGWLEGLFSGIQTAIYAQQMAARAQFEQMRRALPPGMQPGHPGQAGQGHGHPGMPGQQQQPAPGGDEDGGRGGMYL